MLALSLTRSQQKTAARTCHCVRISPRPSMLSTTTTHFVCALWRSLAVRSITIHQLHHGTNILVLATMAHTVLESSHLSAAFAACCLCALVRRGVSFLVRCSAVC